MAKRWLSGWLLLGVLGAAGLWPGWSRPPAVTARVSDPAPEPAVRLQLQGVASSTAKPCHNGGGSRGEKRSEYSTWIAHDKHARAYLVLLEQASRQIEANLKDLRDLKEAHPETNPL